MQTDAIPMPCSLSQGQTVGTMHKSHGNSVAQKQNTMRIQVCCLISRNVEVWLMFPLLNMLSGFLFLKEIFKIFILSMIVKQVHNICRL